MIQLQELRIGNIINYTTAENDILPTTIDWQDLKWISEDQKGFNLVHDPIELTKEWLLNFGFKKNLSSWTNWERPDLTKEVRIRIQGKYLFYNGRIINSVHQVQNLYFALTGKELKKN